MATPAAHNSQSGSTAPPINIKSVTEVISTFRPAKLFRRDDGHGTRAAATVMALDFDDEGGLLVSTESDDTLQIYDAKDGKKLMPCLSKKYGVGNARFTHSSTGIIYSSTKLNNTIRYWTSHNNAYIRYFEGHDDSVTSLQMHPGSDIFLSCSRDNTLRIWDLESRHCAGQLDLHGAYLSAWDPSGSVFAVASPSTQSILLYDHRNYDKEPFATFDVLQANFELAQNEIGSGWTKLEFSNDGNYLLLGTTGPGHLLLDAFDGTLKAVLRRSKNRVGARRLGAGESNAEHLEQTSQDFLYPTTGDACFSSDAKFVLSGGQGSTVQAWEVPNQAEETEGVLYPAHELEHKGDTGVLAWNPRFNMFATGEKEVVFWVPDPNLNS